MCIPRIYFFKSFLNEILQAHKCNYVPRIKKKCMLKQTRKLLHYQSTLIYHFIRDKIVSTCANFIFLNHKISLYFASSRKKYRSFFSVYSICGRFFSFPREIKFWKFNTLFTLLSLFLYLSFSTIYTHWTICVSGYTSITRARLSHRMHEWSPKIDKYIDRIRYTSRNGQ